jgi:competence protein ComEC
MTQQFAKTKIFLICLLGFIGGIALGSFLPNRYLAIDFFWFIIGLFLLAAAIFFQKNKRIMIISLCGLFFILGIWRYAISLPTSTPDKIAFYNNKEIVLQGIVASEPDRRADKQKLDINVSIIKGIDHKVTGKVLVTTNLYPIFYYGDELQIACHLAAPKEFSGFAYDRYLVRYDIYSVCYYPPINKLRGNQGNWFYATIYKLKAAIRNKINSNLSEPQASLASGILLGDMSGAGPDVQLAFSHSGLSHIAAVSGMNVSIIAAVSMSVLLFLGCWRRQAYYLSVLFIIIFIILVGLPASAVRAGVMGFLALTALAYGRTNKLTNALIFAAAVLLFFNPKLLRDDVGFQLSFLAVLGIIYVYPFFRQRFENIKSAVARGALDVLAITVSAQVFTLPIIAYNFSIISLVAPLANLLVLWSITFLTIGLMAVVLISFIFPILAFWLFLPFDLLLRYVVYVAKISSALPGGYLQLDYVWPGWLVFYYIFIGIIVVFYQRRVRPV